MTADTTVVRRARRIGLFGGTFDPVHHGHLAAAWHVLQKLDLDEVWLVVANDPWQKTGDAKVTAASVRLAWVREAVSDVPGLVASDVEIERGGVTYTIDTLTALRATHPDVSWSVVVGADTAAQLDTWHRAEDLREMVEVVVVNRPGVEPEAVPPGWRHRQVTIPNLDISSSELRELAAEGWSLRFLVPSAVAAAIEASAVYRSDPMVDKAEDPEGAE
jgi:nicotinate-nucleotide adenylyltransferase